MAILTTVPSLTKYHSNNPPFYFPPFHVQTWHWKLGTGLSKQNNIPLYMVLWQAKALTILQEHFTIPQTGLPFIKPLQCNSMKTVYEIINIRYRMFKRCCIPWGVLSAVWCWADSAMSNTIIGKERDYLSACSVGQVVLRSNLPGWICEPWTPALPRTGCSQWTENTPTGSPDPQTAGTPGPSACSCWTGPRCWPSPGRRSPGYGWHIWTHTGTVSHIHILLFLHKTDTTSTTFLNHALWSNCCHYKKLLVTEKPPPPPPFHWSLLMHLEFYNGKRNR